MQKVYMCLCISAFLAILSCNNNDDKNDTNFEPVEKNITKEVVLNVSDVS